MALTQHDLNAFHQFAVTRIASGDADSLSALLDDWETEQLTSAEKAENLAAVQAAIRDMQNGDRGRPADQISKEMRAKLANLQ